LGASQLRWKTVCKRAAAPLALSIASLALAACGSSGSTKSSGSQPTASHPQNVSIRLDWFASGYHAGFYAAVKQGFYKAAGLNVTIQDGQGSSSTVALVASGKDTFGFVDPVALIEAAAQGAPVQEVAGVYTSDGAGILVRASSGITNPVQLQGKTCGITSFAYINKLMPAFFSRVGGSWSRVNAVAISPAALDEELAQGKIAGDCDAASVSDPELVSSKGVKVTFLPLSSGGINPLGWGIVAGKSTVASDPALVKAFVAASLKGFQWAFAHPAQSVSELHAMVPNAIDSYKVDVESIEAGQKLVDTSVPFGAIPQSDWTTTIGLVTKYLGVKSAPPVSSLYTTRFLPTS
jgi:NitT/TauT family transport system substrate-binding protein